MKLHISLLMVAALLSAAGSAEAREIRLQPGETYREGDLSLRCEEGAGAGQAAAPLTLRECQYWDAFNKKCLYEKKILTYRDLECVEECQHWDNFRNTCYYESQCTFYPDHGAFVLTACDEFDDFKHVCVRKKETKIGSASPMGRFR